MKIYYQDELFLEVVADDDSTMSKELMGKEYVTLNFSIDHHVEIPIGAYIEHDDERYTLVNPSDITMNHTEDFKYSMTFFSDSYKSRLWYFKNPIDSRLSFDLTATPREHLEMVVDNLNAREQGWSVGECIEHEEKLVSYNFNTIWDALRSIADTFNTEFEFSKKVISLHKVEYDKESPLVVAYGKGKGLLSGVVRKNKTDTPPLDVVYAQGGERNINYAEYGSKTLHLPKGVTIRFDGNHFEGEEGFEEELAKTYTTDDLGLGVSREKDNNGALCEGAFDCTEFYPKRICSVSKVECEDEGKNFYNVFDYSIPNELDYAKCMIPGESMYVIFQSGQLAGRQLSLSMYNHKNRRFEIVPEAIDGVVMPNKDDFRIEEGDTFIVYGCSLPQSYISDRDQGAEWVMLRACVRYLHENSVQFFSFSGRIDPIWLHENYGTANVSLNIGHYLLYRDLSLSSDGIEMRVTNIKRNINNPYNVELSLSNAPVQTDFSDEFRRVSSASSSNDRRITIVSGASTRYTDASMDEVADFEATAGNAQWALDDTLSNTSTRFRFVDDATKTDPIVIETPVRYDKDNDYLSVDTNAMIQHQVMSKKALMPVSSMQFEHYTLEGDTTIAIPSRGVVHVYVDVDIDSKQGRFTATTTKQRETSSPTNILLYIGYLKTWRNGTRQFINCYRWIDDLSASIDARTIASQNGQMSINLSNGSITITDASGNEVFNTIKKQMSFSKVVIDGTDIVQKINTEIVRSNDFNTLFSKLNDAIEAFNNRNPQNKIDFTKCIPIPGPEPSSQVCKEMPDIPTISASPIIDEAPNIG